MYRFINKDGDLRTAIRELESQVSVEPLVALDTETYQTGPETKYGFKDPYTNSVRLLQLKTRYSVSYVFDVKALKDITPLTEFLSRDDITWVGHNCFPEDTKVTLASGEKVEISYLVRNRISAEVLSYNQDTNALEPKRITNWFTNKSTTNWWNLITEDRPWVTSTPDHKFLVEGKGWVQAKDIVAGDYLLNQKLELDEQTKGLLWGSLLGDASIVLSKTSKTKNPYFVVSHSGDYDSSADYVLHKQQVLNRVFSTTLSRKDNSKGFSFGLNRTLHSVRTNSDFRLLPLLDCTKGGHKVITPAWLNNVNAAGLAYWYLDDGTISKPSGNKTRVPSIRCSNRTPEEVETVINWFRDKWSLSVSFSSGSIRFLGDSKLRFFELIKAWVPACMDYKLPEEYRGAYLGKNEVPTTPSRVRVLESKPSVVSKARTRYCIEVEGNHNFFANGILASNCKFDFKMISVNLKVNLKKIYCTYIAAAILGFATGMSARVSCGLGLRDVARDFLDVQISKEQQQSYWGGKLSKEQIEYAAKDVDHIIPLYDLFTKAFRDEYKCVEAVDLEMEVMPVVAKMELNGIGFDMQMYNRVQTCAKAEIPKLIKKLCAYFDVRMQTVFDPVTKRFESKPANVNFNSRDDVLKLFAKKGIDVPDLKAETLLEFSQKFEIVKTFSDYKTLQKQLSVNYEEYVHPISKRIHPEYNQVGAATGRFSCSDPNLTP